MSMRDWAKKEVELACEREEGYGKMCYRSALKAYQTLLEDGHSGMSISFTKNILNRMIEGKPLSPIYDVPEVWNCVCEYKKGLETYQCQRMSSLFKNVRPDGTVTYEDSNRTVCTYDDDSGPVFHNSFIAKIVDEIIGPITMPYYPSSKPYKAVVEDFLYDPKAGDYDTRMLLRVVKPNGGVIPVNRYFAEVGGIFEEIDFGEYTYRWEHRAELNRGNQDDQTE